MAFLGKFTEADAASSLSTSGTRTTTAGSLVVIGGGAWNDATAVGLTLASNQAGTYTEAFEDEFGAFVNLAMAHNIGGTRGAGHSCNISATLSAHVSVSGAEFDGIAATPTVTVGSLATGTSTSVSCSVTVPSGTATVVALMGYDSGGPATIAVLNGTQATEADENNDNQDHSMAYKLGQSGTVTITWGLSASCVWGCRAVAFEETGGAAVPSLITGFKLMGLQ